MTKTQLRAELFRVKGLIRQALLNEAYTNGTKSTLYQEILSVWRDMNKQEYK